MASARIAGGLFLALVAFGGVGAVGACASTPDPNAETTVAVSPEAFRDFAGGGANVGVQGMLAARCGSLDCHGAVGQSLRIFSEFGLRLQDDAGNIPGGAATTPSEIFATYLAVIDIQPELTTKVFHGALDPHELLLLRKPLGLERHKGGQVLASDDVGDICLTTWLTDGLDGGAINNKACNTAAGQL